MAPELRSRKAKADLAKGTPVKEVPSKRAKATAPATKRKAPEDASPVSTKKSKSDGVAIQSKSKADKKEPKLLDTVDDDSQAEVEDEQVQALAEAIDSDDDNDDDSPLDSSVAFKEGQDVGKAPKPSDAVLKASKDSSREEPGVVYVGHIPHGFYEHEMRSYMSQFGPVTKLRISRNRRTGRSKHFAFVEFAENSTAEIVAKTMDNYLLFGHILKCKMVPPSQIHENMWKGANKRFKKVPWNKMAGRKLEKPLSESTWVGKISKEEKRRQERAKKLAAMGYDFDGPKLKSLDDVQRDDPEAIEGANEEKPKAIEAPQEAKEDGEEATPATAEESVEPKQNGAKSTKKTNAAGNKKVKASKAKKMK